MFDDLGAYFCNNLMPTYEDYVAARHASSAGRNQHLRAALELASALFHFREHLPPDRKVSREKAEDECPSYRLIADVAIASKHKALKRKTPSGVALVQSAEDIKEFAVVTRYEDETGEYTNVATTIEVTYSDGSTRNLDQSLTEVLNYWGSKLSGWGVLEFSALERPLFPAQQNVTREEARQLDLEAVRGIRFQQLMQLWRYDSNKGFALPEDITGSTLQFRIYKPAYVATLEFTDRNTGKKQHVDLPFSDEESDAMHSFTNDDERNAYMVSVVERRRDEVQELLSKLDT